MVFTGANADTAKEIAEKIGKNKDREEIINYYSTFIKKYISSKSEDVDREDPKPKKSKIKELNPINVVVANQLFVSDKCKLLDSFVKEMNEKFCGQFQSLDFTDTNLSASTINNFIQEATKGKINELITDEDLDKQTTLILLNVVYFMANWTTKFQPRHEATFYSNIGTRKIDMMTGIFYGINYTNTKEWHTVGIPYMGETTYMYILLPKEKNGLGKVIQKMDYKMFMKCTKENIFDDKIDVTIPVFEISNRYDLCDILSKMGINKMFHKSEANFSRMFKEPRHFVNKAIHMATIKVDENGTEATAATSFGMMPRSAAPPKKFIANHPFIYFVATLEKNKEKNIKVSNSTVDNEEDTDKNDVLVPNKILFSGIYL
uniref:Serpin domain-containing protein n=1 Tax=Panagrolaimus sp. ES5 TaxID=591445 RepID=A0AC34F2B8_9BILA